jgi:hypothetical protein
MTIQFVPQIIMAGTEITPANVHFFMQEGDARQGTPLGEALHNVAIQFDAASLRAARSHDAAVERARDLHSFTDWESDKDLSPWARDLFGSIDWDGPDVIHVPSSRLEA